MTMRAQYLARRVSQEGIRRSLYEYRVAQIATQRRLPALARLLREGAPHSGRPSGDIPKPVRQTEFVQWYRV